MFVKKVSHDDQKKVTEWEIKALDIRREITNRISYIKKINDTITENQFINFLASNFFDIFILFYEEFTHLESNLKAKGGLRTCSEYFKYLCHILKKLIISSPQNIKSGEFYYCIHFVLRKIIHYTNYPKVRCFGIELCVLWLECLQAPLDQYSHSLVDMFFSDLHPLLRSLLSKIPQNYYHFERNVRGSTLNSSNDNLGKLDDINDDIIIWEVALPFASLPANEKILTPDEKLISYIDRFYDFITHNLLKICWRDEKDHEVSLSSIIQIVRIILLDKLFPSTIILEDRYFDKKDDFNKYLERLSNNETFTVFPTNKLIKMTLGWIISHLTTINLENKKSTPNDTETTSMAQTDILMENSISSLEQALENTDISSRKHDDISFKIMIKLFQNAIYKNPRNTLIIFEIFRQIMIDDVLFSDYKYKLFQIMEIWSKPKYAPSFIINNESYENLTSISSPFKMHKHKFYKILFFFSILPFCHEIAKEEEFLIQLPQYMMCLKHIRLYVAYYSVLIDRNSWIMVLERMINILDHMRKYLSLILLKEQENSISSFMEYFFQTIFFTWLRGNLECLIPPQIWNNFTSILKSLPHIHQMFNEYENCLKVISRIYCWTFFNLDTINLPLNKEFDTRKKIKNITRISSKTDKINKKTISFTKIDMPENININLQQYNTSCSTSIKSQQLSGDIPKDIACNNTILAKKKDSDSQIKSDMAVHSDSEIIKIKSRSSYHDSVSYSEDKFEDENQPFNVTQSYVSLKKIDSDSISYQSASPLSTSQMADSVSDAEKHINNMANLDVPIFNDDLNAKKPDNKEELNQLNIDAEHIYVVWKRFLGVFGNVNKLQNPQNQILCYKIYYNLFEILENVMKNIGLDSNLKYSPPIGQNQPDLEIFFPLVFELIFNEGSGHPAILIAEKLALHIMLTDYDLSESAQNYRYLYIECLKMILEHRNAEMITTFFIHAHSIINSKIEGAYILIPKMLESIEYLYQQNHYLPDEITIFLLSMSSYFFCFPDLKCGKLSIKDLEVTYLRILLKWATHSKTKLGRIYFLACLNNIVIENIIRKNNLPLVKMILSVIFRHVYSKSLSVVCFVFTILQTYISFSSYFEDFDKNILWTLFSYCSKGADSTLSNHENTNGKFLLYNSLIYILNVLTNFMISYKVSSSPLFELLQKICVNCKNLGTFENHPTLFEEEYNDKELSNIIHSINDIFDDDYSDNDDNIRVIINKEISQSDTTFEKVLDDRKNTFYLHVQLLADFCILIARNFPLSIGPSSLSCLGDEKDYIPSSMTQSLVFCIRGSSILCLNEIPKQLAITDKKSLNSFHNTFEILIIVRSPLGKYIWTCDELLSKTDPIIESKDKLAMQTHTTQNITSNDPLKNLFDKSYEINPQIYSKSIISADNKTFDSVPDSVYVKKLLIKKSSAEIEHKSNYMADILNIPNLGHKTQNLFKYEICNKLLAGFGSFSNENRANISMLEPSEKFFRDIKQIDSRASRNTHKFAVFYIKEHQEDRDTILQNVDYSNNFYSFLCGLGWLVELEHHQGFTGGLPKTSGKGLQTFYYCSALNEVIYHVAPMMPTDESAGGIISKVRHLGNDEVHIVWTEHYRPFRRGIINTEFADVIIIIYPLHNGLFKIKILKKPEIPIFGPLCDGSVVTFSQLPALVRETAINASHNIRMNHYLFKTTFEDRSNLIKQIKERYSNEQSFEEYLSSFTRLS